MARCRWLVPLVLLAHSLQSAQAQDGDDGASARPDQATAQVILFERIRQIPREQDAQVIDFIRQNIQSLSPYFVMEMSRRLFANDAEIAVHWMHVGYIRAHYDALRCEDPTAIQGTRLLPEIAAEVVAYARSEEAVYRTQGLRALQWPGLFESKLSPWWICSFGQVALQADRQGPPENESEWLRPKRVWPKIRAKLIADFTTTLTELDRPVFGAPPARLD